MFQICLRKLWGNKLCFRPRKRIERRVSAYRFWSYESLGQTKATRRDALTSNNGGAFSATVVVLLFCMDCCKDLQTTCRLPLWATVSWISLSFMCLHAFDCASKADYEQFSGVQLIWLNTLDPSSTARTVGEHGGKTLIPVPHFT